MHERAVHAMSHSMTPYCSCMKFFDHGYEQAVTMHDNIHIHVIMNIIVTPSTMCSSRVSSIKSILSKVTGSSVRRRGRTGAGK